MAEHEYNEGDRVRILADIPHAGYFKGTVRVVQDEPGKRIGVELDEPAINGHSLDGKLDKEKLDPNTGKKMGKGWWVTPENIERI